MSNFLVDLRPDRIVLRGLADATAVDIVGVDPSLHGQQIRVVAGEPGALTRAAGSGWTLYGNPGARPDGTRDPIVVSLPAESDVVTVYVLDEDGEILSPGVLGAVEVVPVSPGSVD